jgi:hypothetical protein
VVVSVVATVPGSHTLHDSGEIAASIKSVMSVKPCFSGRDLVVTAYETQVSPSDPDVPMIRSCSRLRPLYVSHTWHRHKRLCRTISVRLAMPIMTVPEGSGTAVTEI